MKERLLAKRYAKGLFDLMLESKEIEKLESDMLLVKTITVNVPEFIAALEDEKIEMQKRVHATEKICVALGLSKKTQNAITILVIRKRIGIVELMAENILESILRYRNLADVKAQVADASLSEEVKKHIENILGQILKLKVNCKVTIKPDLIGGFVLTMGDRRYDASIIGELRRMKENLIGAEI